MDKKGQKRSRPASSNEKNPRPYKRQYQKLQDARKIAVQSSSPALASGSIDVNAFTSSRSFEITALQTAMRQSKSVLAQRAFQDVPRSLRRRSASHNVKRVPRPLREKAMKEMIADGTKPRIKIRGQKRLRMEKRRLAGKVSAKSAEQPEEMDIVEEGIPKLKVRKVTKGKFAHRQEDKTWLPTHLYYAKRARIEPRFGFSLPITPTEKSFRPTYRASQHAGFIAFDTSYFATLFVHGTEDQIRKVLDMVIEPGSAASGKRYSSGKRSCETTLYHHDEFPRGMIGPALVLWRPGAEETQVMVRVHPAILQEVWDELHVCAKAVGDVGIEDARFEIGAIDLFGPIASEALFAVLKVGKGTCSKVWNQLRGLDNATSLPLGAVLDLDLCDPRVEFPPRKLKQSQSQELPSLIQQWPAHIPGQIPLFNSSSRKDATTYLSTYTRGSLQKARNELLSAGNPPVLPASAPIIPSLLLRRDSGAWTLLLPWQWIQEFWSSFMHYPQSRFGGLTEYSQICFEDRGMAFPEDWPGTKAGDGEGVRMAKQFQKKWERRPDGKRESWGKVLKSGERGEIGDPFSCDWQLFWKEKKGLSGGEDSVDAVEKIRAQAKAAMEVDSGETSTEAGQFLLSPSYAKQLLSRKSPMIATVDLTQALIPIRLRFLQKGNVSFRARIYRLPTSPEERQKWTDLLARDAPKPSKQEYPTCPGEQDLLGFVTTGNMSLSEGRGRAVGALAWSRLEQEQDQRIEEKEFRRWCIVRDVGTDVARLAKWEVND